MKNRPCDLSQKIKRLQKSRDTLKLNSREKTLYNKKLRDRNSEIIKNRDHWKAYSKELICQKKDLEGQLQLVKEEIERERMKLDKERNRANKFKDEIKCIRKKKSRT